MDTLHTYEIVAVVIATLFFVSIFVAGLWAIFKGPSVEDGYTTANPRKNLYKVPK